MRRNYAIGALVIALLVALGIWIARSTYWDEVDERTWMKGEAAANPFYAAQHLAESLGAHAESRHDLLGLPLHRTVLVVGYWNWSIIPWRQARLERWVAEGGRMVLSANLVAFRAVQTWTGVKQVPVEKFVAPDEHHLAGNDPNAPGRYTICKTPTINKLSTTRNTSWRLHDERGDLQIVRVPIGRGSVTLLNYDLFNNRQLLCGDAALLFTAATQLHTGDRIVFLSENSGVSLVSLLWRYAAPAILLAALLVALWIWRSGVRFGPLIAEPDPARRSLAEQIRGTGQFTLRAGGGRALYAAAVRALNEVAGRRLPHFAQLPHEDQVTTLVPLTGLSAGDLRAALDSTTMRRPNEMRKAIAVIEAARRNIAAQ